MDIFTLNLAKRFALSVAAGYSSVEVDEINSAIIFTLNTGEKVVLRIPKLNSIEEIYTQSILLDTGETENHIIVKLTNGTLKDLGKIPDQQILISKEQGNALIKKSDGYYVATTGINIDPSENNMLKNTENGLYVPNINTENNIEQILNIVNENMKTEEGIQNILNAVNSNMETEDLDFSDFF